METARETRLRLQATWTRGRTMRSGACKKLMRSSFIFDGNGLSSVVSRATRMPLLRKASIRRTASSGRVIPPCLSARGHSSSGVAGGAGATFARAIVRAAGQLGRPAHLSSDICIPSWESEQTPGWKSEQMQEPESEQTPSRESEQTPSWSQSKNLQVATKKFTRWSV